MPGAALDEPSTALLILAISSPPSKIVGWVIPCVAARLISCSDELAQNCMQVSRRELTNLRVYKSTVSRLLERVHKTKQVLAEESSGCCGLPSWRNLAVCNTRLEAFDLSMVLLGSPVH